MRFGEEVSPKRLRDECVVGEGDLHRKGGHIVVGGNEHDIAKNNWRAAQADFVIERVRDFPE
jgi:hypothetical protein